MVGWWGVAIKSEALLPLYVYIVKRQSLIFRAVFREKKVPSRYRSNHLDTTRNPKKFEKNNNLNSVINAVFAASNWRYSIQHDLDWQINTKVFGYMSSILIVLFSQPWSQKACLPQLACLVPTPRTKYHCGICIECKVSVLVSNIFKRYLDLLTWMWE